MRRSVIASPPEAGEAIAFFYGLSGSISSFRPELRVPGGGLKFSPLPPRGGGQGGGEVVIPAKAEILRVQFI
jgi:hypothetical protein